MNAKLKTALLLCGIAGMLLGTAARADEEIYEVTVTNLSRGILFTPILLVSHDKGLKLFEAGSPASEPLAQLAEGGATRPLQDALIASGKVRDTAVSAGALAPGASVTLQVSAGGKARYLSLAAMMLPTNDGFIALNGARIAGKHGQQTFYLAGYDAGSEANDELCANIPGPHCGGEGFNAAGGEGYVHVHAGLHGIGNVVPADRDWRNPVARVRVVRSD
jgi:hypothetical protein